MDFGAFWSAGFYAIRDLDEEDFGANYIRGVFLPIVWNIWVLVTSNSFPPVLPFSDH